MTLFTIPDSGKTSVPMTELHYYAWLVKENKQDIHSINTKVEYLKSLGFVKNINRLTYEDLESLKHIEQQYFHVVLRPVLIEKMKQDKVNQTV